MAQALSPGQRELELHVADERQQPGDGEASFMLDLESQLDALLEQIEAVEPGIVPSLKGKPAPTAAPATQPPQPEFDVDDAVAFEAPEAVTAETPAPAEPAAKAPQRERSPDDPSVPEDEAERIMLEQLGLGADGLPAGAAPAAPAEVSAEPPKVSSDSGIATPDDIDSLLNEHIRTTISQKVGEAQAASAEPPAEPEAAQPAPAAPELSPAESLLASLKEALASESAPPKPAATVSAPVEEDDDPLASQIQSLLDDARAFEGSTPAPAVAPMDLAREELGGTFEPPDEAAVADAVAAAPPPPEGRSATPAGADAGDHEPEAPETIDSIDAMLADEADEAVGGEFETVREVTDTRAEAAATGSGPRRAEQARESTDALEAAVQTAAARPAADDEPERPVSLVGPAEDLGGGFDAPEAVGSTEGATAADVARELDEQPERQARSAAHARSSDEQAGAQPRVSLAERMDRRLARPLQAVAATEPSLRRLCARINQPALRLSPEMRDTLGWVALVVAGPGFLLFLYGLLS